MNANEAIQCAVILLADAIASMQDRDETDTESYLQIRDALDLLERVDTSGASKPTFTVFFPTGWCSDECECCDTMDDGVYRDAFTRWTPIVQTDEDGNEEDQWQCEVLL